MCPAKVTACLWLRSSEFEFFVPDLAQTRANHCRSLKNALQNRLLPPLWPPFRTQFQPNPTQFWLKRTQFQAMVTAP